MRVCPRWNITPDPDTGIGSWSDEQLAALSGEVSRRHPLSAACYLPLADVITYYPACPIFVTALSAIVLREHVSWRRWSAVLMLITRSLRATPDIVLASSQFMGTFALGARMSPFGWVAPGIGSLVIRRVSGRPCPARSLPALGRAGRG